MPEPKELFDCYQPGTVLQPYFHTPIVQAISSIFRDESQVLVFVDVFSACPLSTHCRPSSRSSDKGTGYDNELKIMQGLKGRWQRTSGHCCKWTYKWRSGHDFVACQDKRQLASRDDRCQSRQIETAGTKYRRIHTSLHVSFLLNN